jgi:hypothetical protein
MGTREGSIMPRSTTRAWTRTFAARACLTTLSAVSAAIAHAEPVLLYHIAPASFSACDALNESSHQCSNTTVSSSASQDLFVWVIVSDVRDVGGVQFGVEYDSGVGVQAWSLCTGGSQLPDVAWPSSGSGSAISWAGGCWDRGSFAKVGFFYVRGGSSGNMRFIADPRIGQLQLADCEAELTEFCPRNGEASLGSSGGFLPSGCLCTTGFVEEQSWARIKNTYQSP